MPDPRELTLETFGQELVRLRRVTGWVLLVCPLLFGATALAVGLWGGLRVPIALGLFFLLLASVLAGFRSTLKWREQAFASRVEDPAAAIGPVPFASRALPYLAGLFAIALSTAPLWSTGLPESWSAWTVLGEPESDVFEARLIAWGCVAAAVLSALFAQYFAAASQGVAPEAAGVANWFRASTWIALVGGASLFVRTFAEPWREDLIASFLLGVVAFLGAEILFRSLWTTSLGYFERVQHPGGRVGTDLLSLRILCSRFNPSASFFSVLASVFGLDLRGAWALTFMRRSVAPLAAGLALVGWLSTSFVMVEPPYVGLLERFGKLVLEPLRPGLHVVLPWPMSRVTQVPVHRVQMIPIGFSGAREDASILWTVQHAEEEYKLLLGDGRDLVTVNASLHYRIDDPVAYAYSVQNPDATLAILADRVLMQRTVGRSLDEVLSENLAALGTELEREIQAASDEHDLGIEIVDLTLAGLHPPVRVAAAYQGVVAAKVDQSTNILRAEAYRATALPEAEGKAAELDNQARTHRVTRLATARGEAEAFQALLASYLASPQAFRLVRYLEAMETQLSDKKLNVLDHTIEEAGASIWLLK